MDDRTQLEKQIRVLARKLERSEEDRIQLEDTKDKNDSLLRKVIGELEDSKKAMQRKSVELQTAIVELQEAQTELIQSAKMAALGELVAGVAHEINTPIGIGVTAASHLSDTVKEIRAETAEGKLSKTGFSRFLDSCDESSEILLSNLSRASELIQSFKLVAVDQSRSGARLFDVGEYLSEITRSVSAPLRKSNLVFSLDGPGGLFMNGDPGLLAQVVTNLVMNSILHAYEEGEHGQLKLTYSAENDKLMLVFTDDGKGIPAADLPKIYNPFFTTKRGEGGSGLGLNIIYNIVTREMGGSISCESEVDKGVRFTLAVPGVIVEAVAETSNKTA